MKLKKKIHAPQEQWNPSLEDLGHMLTLIGWQDYEDWMVVASGAWNHFGLAATKILRDHNPEERRTEYPDTIPINYTNIYTSRDQNITIEFVIELAIQNGYCRALAPAGATKAEKLADDFAPPKTTACRAFLRGKLEARAFDLCEEIPPPDPILSLGGKIISTPGNLTNIQAPAKAGKTAVVEAIMAAMVNGNRDDVDTLGFTAINIEEKAVIHIDTEQSPYDHDRCLRKAFSRANVEVSPQWLHSYSLADLPVADRRKLLRHAIDSHGEDHGGVFAILIDGVADLCHSVMDPDESIALVTWLHTTAIENECAIITVLHENPGSETGKTRGHLGSEIERKAETPLRLAKSAATGITTIWADRARRCHIPKKEGTCFAWSDMHGMHMSVGSAFETKASDNRVKYAEEARSAFGLLEELTWSDLRDAVMKVTELGKEAAKKRITAYIAEGIMIKKAVGIYALNNKGKGV